MHDEPTLDGMPEPTPAWVRPDQGVRLSALLLQRSLQQALQHAGVDEENFPVLCSVRLAVEKNIGETLRALRGVDLRDLADLRPDSGGLLTVMATDRYSQSRERLPVTQTCDDFTFLLRTDDAKSLVSLLKVLLRHIDKDLRDVEPVDVVLEPTDDGPTLRVLGQDLDVRFTEREDPHFFPDVDTLTERILQTANGSSPAPFDVYLAPLLAARLHVAQSVRASGTFRWRCATPDLLADEVTGVVTEKQRPVVVEPHDDEDDLVVCLMPIRVGADQ